MIDNETHFKGLIMSFHKLRISGLISEKESKSIFKRYCKMVKDAGYTFEDKGFYQYEFKKVDE